MQVARLFYWPLAPRARAIVVEEGGQWHEHDDRSTECEHLESEPCSSRHAAIFRAASRARGRAAWLFITIR